ncbi:hypothetical protein Staley_88 [Bacillus phage Staley]|uniref:Uncharacterized protein n=1 Tax=Bacillus phage Staley TaxID=1406792 RepID=U5PY97_9CAUD|nr:hypothetical protein Staley_88 [Bacillus phage Staley]AGY48771.1 hypothetical protein Staley_88 [Bacillus phage Staley]
MNQVPQFNPNFAYNNLGMVVGKLVYGSPALRQDQTEYGWDFLLNATGFGSVNLRIPMLDKAQASINEFPITDPKPRVRAGLAQISQFVTTTGKTFTNFTSFVELEKPITVKGEEMEDKVSGRLSGEMFGKQQSKDGIQFKLVFYATDRKDKKKRATRANGDFIDASVLTLEATDPAIAQQIANTPDGANVDIGYYYINKDDVTYDEFGMAEGSGEKIERIEVKKFKMLKAPEGGGFSNGFAGQQNGFQQQGFQNQQQQQQQGPPPGFNPPNENGGFSQGNETQFNQQQANNFQQQTFGGQAGFEQQQGFNQQQGGQQFPGSDTGYTGQFPFGS